MEFKEVIQVEADIWSVKRYGKLEEVVAWDGRVRWRVLVWDEGRAPFINQLFADKGKAYDFYERVKDG